MLGVAPLLDQAGNVVGVVTAKMNAIKMAKYSGDIPQNVNFALKASLVRDMLEVKDIDYETASSKKELKTVDIFDKAIHCVGGVFAVTTPTSSLNPLF
jgi:hypothetical protein